jgi:hypothetical protein
VLDEALKTTDLAREAVGYSGVFGGSRSLAALYSVGNGSTRGGAPSK